MKIVHKYTGKTLYECDCDTLEEMEEYALKNGAEFIDTSCWRLDGNKNEIKTLEVDGHKITFTRDVMSIGCLCYLIRDWKYHGANLMMRLGADALVFWLEQKNFIFSEIESSFKVKAQ